MYFSHYIHSDSFTTSLATSIPVIATLPANALLNGFTATLSAAIEKLVEWVGKFLGMNLVGLGGPNPGSKLNVPKKFVHYWPFRHQPT